MKARLHCVLTVATGLASVAVAAHAETALTLCGEAAWFDAGGLTASGEISDAETLTAAHPDLPFGTRVAVDNLGNGRSAIVRINDRASFTRGRVILVSRAAAERLGMIGDGTADVRLSVLDGDEPARRESCAIAGDPVSTAADTPRPSPNPFPAARLSDEGDAGAAAPIEQGSAPSEPDPPGASPASLDSRFDVAFRPQSWQEEELAKVLAAVAPRALTRHQRTRAVPARPRARIALPPNGLFPDFVGYLWSTEISMPHLARFAPTTSPGRLSQLSR